MVGSRGIAESSAWCSVLTQRNGMWGGVREVKEEGDICIHIADSLHCTAQTQHCRATRHPPPKKKKSEWRAPVDVLLAHWALLIPGGIQVGRRNNVLLLLLQGISENFPPLILYLVIPDYFRSPDVGLGNPVLCSVNVRLVSAFLEQKALCDRNPTALFSAMLSTWSTKQTLS